MPPLIHLVTCWLAGAFAGSAQALDAVPVAWLVTAAAIAATLLGWVAGTSDTSRGAHRPALCVGLASVAMAGVVGARASVSQERACRLGIAAAIANDGLVRTVFDDRVAAGATSRGVAAGPGALASCRVPVVARIAAGAAAPGHWVRFAGRAIVTTRGLRIDGDIAGLPRADRDWRRVARGRTGEIIDRDFGRHAPLVRALLIADQDGIAPTVRDTFADAGLVHLLSISGLHVAIIAGALLTLAGALRVGRTASYVAAMLVITGYVVVLGAPAPAVRSAVMLGVVGLAERRQRPTHPWTALALGAAIPAWQPAVVLDLGWQLSVSGMAALVAARALLRRLRHAERRGRPRWSRRALARFQGLDGWRYGLARELVTGTVATIVTAPLIAWTFGRVSLVAPFSNLAAGPLVAFVQPALFLALLAAPWPSLSGFVASASAPPLVLLDVVARLSASVPGAALHVAPTAAGAACAGLAAAAFVRATASRRWAPGLVVAAAALTLAVWSPAIGHGSGRLELHVLDVGQGDALALRTPRGNWILIDAGRRWDGGDAGRRTVVPYVRRLGGRVAGFILTHAHEDHVGGAASVIAALAPERWWEPAFATGSAAYRDALVTLRRTQGIWHRARPGDRWQVDGVDLRVLAPDSAWTAAQTDANESSVVLRVALHDVVFLLTGDAEAEEERWLLANAESGVLRADVLKLAHHGSRTSSTSPFLDAVSPRIGVVSVGAGNSYGHPSPETLRAFADRGVPLLRTDRDGTLVVSTDGRIVDVEVGRERWTLPGRTRSGNALAPNHH